MTRTWVGRAAYAYAQNPEAAALMGVRTNVLQAGVASTPRRWRAWAARFTRASTRSTPAIGSGYILKGVEAAILAGIGSVMGSFAGGIIIGVTEGIGSIFLPSAYSDAYGLIFLVLILLFKPAGLFAANR